MTVKLTNARTKGQATTRFALLLVLSTVVVGVLMIPRFTADAVETTPCPSLGSGGGSECYISDTLITCEEGNFTSTTTDGTPVPATIDESTTLLSPVPVCPYAEIQAPEPEVDFTPGYHWSTTTFCQTSATMGVPTIHEMRKKIYYQGHPTPAYHLTYSHDLEAGVETDTIITIYASVISDGTGYTSSTAAVPVARFLAHVTTPDLQLADSIASVGEGNGTLDLTVSRTCSHDASPSVIVNLTLSPQDSRVTIPASVTIPAGQASTTFTITFIDDDYAYVGEPGTTIEIAATAPSHNPDTTSFILLDDDGPASLALTFDREAIAENAGDDAAIGTITRDSDPAEQLSVTLENPDPTEITIPSSAVFAVGASTATFSVDAVDDIEEDGDIQVQVSASADSHSEGSGEITVLNDDTTIDITFQSLSEAQEVDPGGYLLVNSNDSNENEVEDKAESPISPADPDILPITLSLSTVPSIGTVTLTLPDGVKLWDSASKGEELPSTRSWDMTDPTARDELIDVFLSTIYLEGTTSGTGSVTLGHSNGTDDSVTITLLDIKLDITKVPSWLFASSTYGTPLHFTLSGLPSGEKIDGISGEGVTFSVDGVDYSPQPICTVIQPSSGTWLELSASNLTETDRDFITLVDTSSFATIQLDGPADSAVFGLKLNLSFKTLSIELRSGDGEVSNAFYPIQYPCIDMKKEKQAILAPPNTRFRYGGGYRKSRLVEFSPNASWNGVYWEYFIANSIDLFFCDDNTNPHWYFIRGISDYPIPINASSEVQEVLDTTMSPPTCGDTPPATPTYSGPGSAWNNTSPQLSTVIELRPSGTSSPSTSGAYDTLSAPSYATTSGFYAEMHTVSQYDDDARGTYLNENKGLSAGIVTYISWPGQTVSVGGVSIVAMDLDYFTGFIDVTLGDGTVTAGADSHSVSTSDVYDTVSVILGGSATIMGAFGFVPGTAITTAGSLIFQNMAVASPDVDKTGTAQAEFSAYSHIGRDGETTTVQLLDNIKANLNDTYQSKRPSAVVSSASVRVGDKVEAWMTCNALTQLQADHGFFETWNQAWAEYTFDGSLGFEEYQVTLWVPTED